LSDGFVFTRGRLRACFRARFLARFGRPALTIGDRLGLINQMQIMAELVGEILVSGVGCPDAVINSQRVAGVIQEAGALLGVKLGDLRGG